MPIYKATVILIVDGVHEVHVVDVIEHAGEFWLVPEWLDNQAQGVTMPVRMISLATIPHQRMGPHPQFVVNDPIPKSIFAGQIPPTEAHNYIVLERPEIRLPIPPRYH